MRPSSPELIIVLPAFNEQASVRKVVMEWFQEIENWTENFVLLAIDDGSSDATPAIFARLQERLGERLEVVKQTNHGHGQTCLNGYRLAIERGIPFVLQIDSDGQCDPQYFFRLWRIRKDCDVVYGKRVFREDGWRRSVASLVLKWTVFLSTGAWCVDANVPYRLMHTEILAPVVSRIGPGFFLANIAVAVLLRKTPGIRHGAIPIRFRERYGGEPKVPLSKFFDKAVELVNQLRRLKSVS